jgi:hypothetical protein
MMTNITYGTFLFFGCSIVVGITVALLFMPETSGLTLEDMDIMFNIPGFGHSKRRKTDEIIAERRTAETLVKIDGEKVSAEHIA